MDTVKIDGITYNVIEKYTADDYDRKGLKNLARVVREYQHKGVFTLQRPSGKLYYSAVQYKTGHFSKVNRIPGI